MNEKSLPRMALANLSPHPNQMEYYNDCSPADDQELAADLKKRGQQSPIVVMPPDNVAGLPGGTILDGCRRARALRANGQTEAWVLVRDDLKQADATVVQSEFLRFNYTRRQLHPLDKARVVKKLYENERKRSAKSFSCWERTALRDRVGKAIGMSGRNLDRYMNVLKTPKAVQDAVRDGRLKLVPGSRVASLPEPRQRELAEAIDGLTDKKLINQLTSDALAISVDRRHVTAYSAGQHFVKDLEKGLVDLADRVERIDPEEARKYLTTLTRAAKMIQQLIRRARGATGRRQVKRQRGDHPSPRTPVH